MILLYSYFLIFSLFFSSIFSLDFLHIKKTYKESFLIFSKHNKICENPEDNILIEKYIKTPEGRTFFCKLFSGDSFIIDHFEEMTEKNVNNVNYDLFLTLDEESDNDNLNIFRDYCFAIICYYTLCKKCISCLTESKSNWSLSEVALFSYSISRLPFNQMFEMINLFWRELYSAVTAAQNPNDLALLETENPGFLFKLKNVFNILIQKKWMIPIIFFSFIYFSSNLVENFKL